jgi:hypothetical protein
LPEFTSCRITRAICGAIFVRRISCVPSVDASSTTMISLFGTGDASTASISVSSVRASL